MTPRSANRFATAPGVRGRTARGCDSPTRQLPLRIDDNLTIPIVVGFATWAITARFGVRLT